MLKQTYATGQKDHFDVLRSYEVHAPAGEPDHESLHEGLELIFLPRAVRHSNTAMKIRKKNYLVQQGSFLLFNPREDHTEIYSREEHGSVRAIVFTESMVEDVLQDSGIRAGEIIFDRIEHDLDEELSRELSQLFSFRDGRDVSRLAFDCQATVLLLSLLERCSSSVSGQLRKQKSTGRFPSNLARAKKIMSENLSNSDLSLQDLSDLAGISKFHLIRNFQSHTGVSAMSYLRALRMEHAKGLLAQGKSVSETCFEVGFDNFSTFNKAFKRHTCLSPLSYKNRQRTV